MATASSQQSLLARFKAPEAVFAVLGLFFGTVLLVVTPPIQVPDENAHFWRACQLAEGTVVPVKVGDKAGGYLPVGILNFSNAFAVYCGRPKRKIRDPIATLRRAVADFRVDPHDREFTGFPNTAAYPPLPYLPQALAIAAVRTFSTSAVACLYGARLLNLLTAIVLVALAIRTTPVLKWTFVLLALTPMSLFLMASVSADAVTNAVCFLFAGSVFRCALASGTRLSRRELGTLGVLVIAVGLTKPGYYPLAMLCAMIPAERWGGRGRYWLGVGLLVAVTAVVVGAWGLVVRQIYTPVESYVNPRLQLQHILAHPGAFTLVLMRTALAPGFVWRHMVHYVGALGWLETPLPTLVVCLHLPILALVAALDVAPAAPRVARWQRLVALTVCVLNWLAIATTGYLAWMSVGQQYVLLQGRYFIPLGPPFFFCLYNVLRRNPAAANRARPVLPFLVTLYVVAIFVVTVWTLVERFYAP